MGTMLLILQVILGVKFVTVAFTHGLTQADLEMQQAKQRIGASAQPWLVLASLSTFLGGVGLILPVLIPDLAWLVPWAAASLAVMMVISIRLHLAGRERPKLWADLVLLFLAAIVAFGRLVIAPR